MEEQRDRVFISSTVHDLIDLRAELAAHLRELGVEPLLAEHPEFGKISDEGAIELCKRRIEDSQVVLVVLDARYGDPLTEYEGRSATRVEYDHALACDKKPHVFVRDRVLAAKDLWTKAGRVEGEYGPVRKEHAGALFGWIEELERDKRWMSQFHDSLDIKRRVNGLLERQAERAFLSEGMRNGSIPFLVPMLNYRGMERGFYEFRIGLQNFGHKIVLDVVLRVETDSENLPFLQPNQRWDALSFERPASSTSTTDTAVEAKIEFTTSSGQRYEQAWSLALEAGVPQAALKSIRLLSRQAFTLGTAALADEPPA